MEETIQSNNSLTPYQKTVLTTLLKIPEGKVTTYKNIADYISSSPRAVGTAIKRNPYAPKVPCHRVIKSDGTLGGYTKDNSQDPSVKLELLKKEGVKVYVDEMTKLWHVPRDFLFNFE